MTRTSSSSSYSSAAARRCQRKAASMSKREILLPAAAPAGAASSRNADISFGPKKNARCTSGSWWASTSWLPPAAVSSYSGCRCVTTGGDRAMSSSLAHTGGTVGAGMPRDISPIARRSCTVPAASAMLWHICRPNTKPPHLSRVTYHFNVHNISLHVGESRSGRPTTAAQLPSGSHRSSW
ncbi:Os07g0550750 [Oryza sativa Japonica Group]|uniref:Os07g0550750 protein n=1 Tax=Oryza sativa subsp. japonica TaxID=39947 RepID=A0A0P0X722_ORYSJ|nr:hypothetical protein EE612_039913 [Oryza sativa]BAT02047.1 Os07g0550750 [Oryza sativa Japonica Group]